MLRLFRIDQGLLREIAVEPERLQDQLQTAQWIDVLDSDERERELVESFLQTDLPESEEVDEIEISSRCFTDQAGIHVHAMFLASVDGRHQTESVACILQSERLITIRDEDFPDFRLLRMRARLGQVESSTTEEILVTLFEQKVENHADNLEDIHRQLETLSHAVLSDEDADLEEAISTLAELEDSNGKIRLCLMDSKRDISFLLRHLHNRQHHAETLREIMRDVETLMSHTTFLFDKINFLMDSTQGFINIEQNQIIKIFSIAAVVFLPPTLVASIYGMNFAYLPELHLRFGYPLALLLMLLSGIAPYVFFKRKGWL